MSSVASFFIIETSRLKELASNAEIRIEKKLFSKKEIDNFWNYLDANARRIKEFGWSGHIFANLLPFLDEKGIHLMTGQHDDIADDICTKRQNTTFILTFEHRQRHLDMLSASNYSKEELRKFNIEFSGEDDTELVQAELDGIGYLHDCLAMLVDDSNVILIAIG